MTKKKRAIVSVTNDLYTDNRVNKICLFLVEEGYDVLLVGRLRKNSLPLASRYYQTKRMKLLFDKGPLFYAAYNLRLFFFLLVQRADVLVANDLDTLLANFVAKKVKPSTKLVYDSHEYFTEVPELTKRPSVQRFWLGIEKFIFPKLKTIYTVNQSIAQLYEATYKKNIQVIRNISPTWKPNTYLSKAELGIPENKFVLILQGAGINVDRGAEEAVEAMRQLNNCVLLIVGDGDVVEELKKNVNEYDLQHSVLFFGKRPYDEMMQFTYNADLGLTLDKATNLNYKFSLPNKVFDYIHAGTPILSTRLVEIGRIIERNNVGILIDELTVDSLVEAIQSLQTNKSLLDELKANCKKAAKVENWDEEKKILKEIYSNLG
jgi:glycosyltransferase involved in cell wall biosynthesis